MSRVRKLVKTGSSRKTEAGPSLHCRLATMLRLSQVTADAGHALQVLACHPAAARSTGNNMNMHAMMWCSALSRAAPAGPHPCAPVFTAIARKKTLSPLAVHRTAAVKALWAAARAVLPQQAPAGLVVAVMANAGLLSCSSSDVRRQFQEQLEACLGRLGEAAPRTPACSLGPAAIGQASFVATRRSRLQLPRNAQAYEAGKVFMPFPELKAPPKTANEFTLSTAALRQRFTSPKSRAWEAAARRRKQEKASSMEEILRHDNVVDLW